MVVDMELASAEGSCETTGILVDILQGCYQVRLERNEDRGKGRGVGDGDGSTLALNR